MKSLVPSLGIIFLKQSISSSTGLDWVNSRKSENIEVSKIPLYDFLWFGASSQRKGVLLRKLEDCCAERKEVPPLVLTEAFRVGHCLVRRRA